MDKELIRLIQERINQYNVGDEFEISELMDSEWLNIPNPTQFGKDFKNLVQNENVFLNIEFMFKRTDNHGIYRRV